MKKLAFCTLFNPDDRSVWGGKHYLMLKALREHFDVSVISSLYDNPAIAKITNKYFRVLKTDKDKSTEIRSCLEALGGFFQDRISKDNSDFLFFPNNLCAAYISSVKPMILSMDSLTKSYLSDKNYLYERYPLIFFEALRAIFKNNIDIQFPTYYESLPFWGVIEKKDFFEAGLEDNEILDQLVEKEIIKKFSETQLVLAPGLENKKDEVRLILKDKFNIVFPLLRKTYIDLNLQESSRSDVYGVAYGPQYANKLPKQDTLLFRKNYTPSQCRLLLAGSDWNVDGGDKAYQIMLDLNRMGLPCELAVYGCVPPKEIKHSFIKIIKVSSQKPHHDVLSEEFKKASFLLALTTQDEFSQNVAQAASWGLPVIGLNTGNLRFMIKQGHNGFLFDKEKHSSDFAETIYKVYKDESLYLDLCQKSYERYDYSLNWETWGDQTSKVFNSLASKGVNSNATENISYKKEKNGQYFPLYKFIEIDVTYRCNLKCFNCNRSCGVSPSTEDVTLEQIERFIAESKERHHIWSQIKLIGGEATLHPQIFEIVDLMLGYKKDFPQTEIFLATNGHGEFVQDIVKRMPLEIHIINTKKTTKAQEFVPMNVAPVDAGVNVGLNPGCSIMRCGVGLNSFGYYHCSVAGGIDRLFGYNLGRKELPSYDDAMLKERLRLCRMCGFQIHNAKKVTKQVTSPSWKKVLKEAQTEKSKLTRY